MKKILFSFAFLLAFFCSCTNCNNKQDQEIVEVDSLLTIDEIIDDDFAYMVDKFGEDNLRWYECDVLLNNFLDEECDGSIAEFVNIYQVVTRTDSTSFDTQVYKIQHLPSGDIYEDSIKGFWIEDFPLNLDELKVDYDSAFNLVMAVNLPKPHSQYVTLRKPIGPVPCNVQWVFGNIKSQIWVDGVTGEIKESNPAFPEEKGFKMPLGEWP